MNADDFDLDDLEWTAEDFARARPASEVLPRHIAASLVRPRSVTSHDAVLRQDRMARGWGLAA